MAKILEHLLFNRSKSKFFSKIVLGKVVSNDAELDLDLAYTLLDLGRDLPFDVVTGKTVCTNDFYEGSCFVISFYCKESISLYQNF